MNKQEAIKIIKNIERIKYSSMEFVEEIISIISQIDEQQKVVVPSIVANWYTIIVESGFDPLDNFKNIIFKMGKYDGRNKNYNYDTGIYKWIKETPNAIQIVSNMHQFGYEVEQEKLYVVAIPDEERGNFIQLWKYNNKLLFNEESKIRTGKVYKLTEQEIKNKDERLWNFAIPVEDINE